jgi:chaperonin cofactor prefoldin
MTKDEVVEEMEDYKARLEAEITTLEKRIGSLKEKQ